MTYVCFDHKRVAKCDLGIYNWKQHSTGYLLNVLRHYRIFKGWDYEWHWVKLSSNPELAHTTQIYWYNEWLDRVRDELSKRPHQTTKRERKKKLPKENSSGAATRKRQERLKNFLS